MMNKICITGIGGYVGSNLASFLKKDYHIIGVGRPTNFLELKKRFVSHLDLVAADVADEALWGPMAEGVDVIIHTAGPILEKYCREHPHEARRSIVEGTRVVSRLAQKIGAFFIHFSTFSVYSSYRLRPMPLREESKLLPDTLYGDLKARAEMEVIPESSVILRPSHIYGYLGGIKPNVERVVEIFEKCVRQNEPLIIFGDGEEKIDLVHIRDVGEVVKFCIENRTKIPPILNVGGGNPLSVKRLAHKFQELVNKILKKDISIEYQEMSEGRAKASRWLSIEGLCSIAPWFPRMTLDAGLEEIIKQMHE